MREVGAGGGGAVLVHVISDAQGGGSPLGKAPTDSPRLPKASRSLTEHTCGVSWMEISVDLGQFSAVKITDT